MSQEFTLRLEFLGFRPGRLLALMSLMSGHDQARYPEVDRLLRLREVAELLALSEPSIRRLSRSGALPSVRIGAAVRFRRSDVQRMMIEANPGPEAQRADTSEGR